MSRESRNGSHTKAAAPSVEHLRAALRAALDGDKSAFDQLFDKSFDALYAIAWKLSGDQALAERLTENVLTCAVEALLPAHSESQSDADRGPESVVPTQLDL
jgi:hypothetical protein